MMEDIKYAYKYLNQFLCEESEWDFHFQNQTLKVLTFIKPKWQIFRVHGEL